MDNNLPFDTQYIVTIVMVSHNKRALLNQCLNSVQQNVIGLRAKVIVIDNDSRDGSAAMVRNEFPHFQLIRCDQNLGFASASNLAFRQARSRYIVLLQPDIMLAENTLQQAIGIMNDHLLVGLAGGKLVDEHNQQQEAGYLFPSLLNEFLHHSGLAQKYPQSRFFARFSRTWAIPAHQAAQVDWVSSKFIIVRREVLREIGCFDERFFLYFEDTDLCRRVSEVGWQVWHYPELIAYKLTQQTDSNIKSQLCHTRSTLLYYRKHHSFLTTWLATKLSICMRCICYRWAKHHHQYAKAANLLSQANLIKQAWQETSGGKHSPEKPW